jgi:hypothetical protein
VEGVRWRRERETQQRARGGGAVDSNHFVGLDNLTKNIVSFLGNFSFTVLFF